MSKQAGPALYAWWIGARYLRARRDNRFVGFISGISMAGIALGVAVLIAVLSVMNGFERDLQARILGVVSHATLEGMEGRLDDWQTLRRRTTGEAVPTSTTAAAAARSAAPNAIPRTADRRAEPCMERTSCRPLGPALRSPLLPVYFPRYGLMIRYCRCVSLQP